MFVICHIIVILGHQTPLCSIFQNTKQMFIIFFQDIVHQLQTSGKTDQNVKVCFNEIINIQMVFFLLKSASSNLSFMMSSYN